jgi:hypothetical protein
MVVLAENAGACFLADVTREDRTAIYSVGDVMHGCFDVVHGLGDVMNRHFDVVLRVR